MGWAWRGLAMAAGLALAIPSSARAEERPRVDVTTWISVVTQYDAVEGCPSEEELEQRVRDLVQTRAREIEAHVAITESEGTLEAHIDVFEAETSATRTLHARTCDALASTVALVIAMVIDPSAVERAAAAESPAPSPATAASPAPSLAAALARSPETPPRPPSPPPPPPPPPAAPSIDLAFVADAFFVGGAGLLPQPSFGALALFGVRIDGFEIALGGAVLAESRAAISSTRGGDFGLAQGRLRLAYAIRLAPFELVPAVAIDVGATWGRGYGVVRPGSGMALSVDVAAGLEARVFFTREVGLALFGELTVPLLRPEFVLTGIATTPVFRASEVGTFFGLGVVLVLR